MTMRLATFNILHGRSLTDGQVDPARLTAAAAELDADVLGIQEVDSGQERTGFLDQTAHVAQAMGALEHRFVAALTGVPGGEWRSAQEQTPALKQAPALSAYGVGLVSRLPVKAWHVLRLPASRVWVPLPIPGTRQLIWLKDEPRVVVAAELDGVTVATTHLSFVAGWNVLQLRRAARWLATLPGPHVLMGDLNQPRPVAQRASGWTSLVTAKSFPADDAKVQLDHVLASAALPVRNARAHRLPLSDHRALTVDLGQLGP